MGLIIFYLLDIWILNAFCVFYVQIIMCCSLYVQFNINYICAKIYKINWMQCFSRSTIHVFFTSIFDNHITWHDKSSVNILLSFSSLKSLWQFKLLMLERMTLYFQNRKMSQPNTKLELNRHLDWIRVITKLPNSEQSYKGKVKTHKYINRQNRSKTGKLWKP